MRGDWKREQEMVLQLEKDVRFKDEQLMRTQEANASQRMKIDNLHQELRNKTAEMKLMIPKTNSSGRQRERSSIDFKSQQNDNNKQMEMDRQVILDLEEKLEARTAQFEEVHENYVTLQE